MEQYDEYQMYRQQLSTWLDKHIFSYGGELFNELINKGVISWDDIENLYEELNPNYYESKEDFLEAYNNQEPQEVMQWYIVSDEGYEKFKKVGYPVVKFKELNFYGRTAYGQSIEMDFYYSINKIKKIISNE